MCSPKTSEKISLSLVLSHLFKLENSPQLVQLGNWNMSCDVGQTISKDYINILTELLMYLILLGFVFGLLAL